MRDIEAFSSESTSKEGWELVRVGAWWGKWRGGGREGGIERSPRTDLLKLVSSTYDFLLGK